MLPPEARRESEVDRLQTIIRSAERITLRAQPKDTEVQFSVSDTGPGIAEEQRAHLFDPYWQAKKGTAEGVELGLPISEGIVEAHGGRISVESEVGEGRTFRFTVPLLGMQ